MPEKEIKFLLEQIHKEKEIDDNPILKNIVIVERLSNNDITWKYYKDYLLQCDMSIIDEEYEDNWICIIIKKEEPKPKYVPFVNEKEFLGACYNNETEKLYGIYHYLATHGIWLKNRESDDLFMVVEIWDDGVVIGSNQFTTTWNDLRNEYTFLNGSQCGKEINNAED